MLLQTLNNFNVVLFYLPQYVALPDEIPQKNILILRFALASVYDTTAQPQLCDIERKANVKLANVSSSFPG